MFLNRDFAFFHIYDIVKPEVLGMDFISVFLPALILGVVIVAVLVVVATIASAVTAGAVVEEDDDE